jgi:hypothetical protein
MTESGNVLSVPASHFVVEWLGTREVWRWTRFRVSIRRPPGHLLLYSSRTIERQKNNYVRHVVAPADSLQGLHSKREFAIGLSLGAKIQSVDLSSRCELLCYLIDPVGIERNMPPYLHNSRKRILV